MATVQRVFGSMDTSTFLDGGSEAFVDENGTASETIFLDQWEGAHCYVEAEFVEGPTDDLEIEVLSSPDGNSFDSIPLFSFTIDNGNGHDNVSFIVTSVYAFKINFKSSGSTDSVNVLFYHRKWRWETG